MAILSKTWWRSIVGGESEGSETQLEAGSDREGGEGSDDPRDNQDDRIEDRHAQGSEDEEGVAASAHEDEEPRRDERPREPRPERSRDNRPRYGRPNDRNDRRRNEPRPDRRNAEADRDSEDDDSSDETYRHESAEGFRQEEDDPLEEAYGLNAEGNRDEEVSKPRRQEARAKIDSAKEFFATELLYRYDILEVEDRNALKGSYRLELKGNKGGIWTLFVADDVQVVNRREEADVVLSMQQNDFVSIVNGVLNPQLAIVAQKVRAQGDIRRAILFQSLLAPASE